MQSKVIAAKRQLQDYNLSKFTMILQALMNKRSKQLKTQAFSSVKQYSTHLAFKHAKFQKFLSYSKKSNFFRLWHSIY